MSGGFKRATVEELLEDADHEVLLLDGFDDALVGVVERFGLAPQACYDRAACIEILKRDSAMTDEEAEEYFQHNVIGAWMGEGTPFFLTVVEDA